MISDGHQPGPSFPSPYSPRGREILLDRDIARRVGAGAVVESRTGHTAVLAVIPDPAEHPMLARLAGASLWPKARVRLRIDDQARIEIG